MASNNDAGTTHKYRWDSRYGMPYSVQASFASSIGTYGNRRQNTDASSRDSEEETSGDVVGIAAHRLPFAPHKSRRAAPLINRPLIPINTRRQLCLEKQIDNQGATPTSLAWNLHIEQETACSTSCETSASSSPRDARRLRFANSTERRVKVEVSAERLRQNSPSTEALLYKKGRKALTFHDSCRDDGFVFGSHEGEHCLLRIRIESVRDDAIIPIENVTHVQLLHQMGRTRNLQIAETENRAYVKETTALLEPWMLRRRRGAARDEAMLTEELIFQLHIRVALEGAGRCEDDIVKTFCWRTVPKVKRTVPLCWKGIHMQTRSPAPRSLQTDRTSVPNSMGDGRVDCQRRRWTRGRREMTTFLPKVSWLHTLSVCCDADA